MWKYVSINLKFLSFLSLSSLSLSLSLSPPPSFTGSGKSYTMMGTGSDEPATKGLIPRICDGLFARMKDVSGADWPLPLIITPILL